MLSKSKKIELLPHSLYISNYLPNWDLDGSFWLYVSLSILSFISLQVLHKIKVSCQCQCPVVYRSGTSDRCTIMWKTPTIVSCSLLQISVSLTIPNEIPIYSDCFGQNITSIQTLPLSANTVYTATITDECGSTCSVNCSTVQIDGKNVTRYQYYVCHVVSHLTISMSQC